MSLEHIASIMHDFLHRGVERSDKDLLQFEQKEEFYKATSKTYTVNLIAFALGHIQHGIADLGQFEKSDLLPDQKLRDSLTTIVNRMPSLEFQFIPLVLLRDDRLVASFLLRVRKAPKSTECIYLDLTNRKYELFEEFLSKNKLPECTLWYPKNGLLRYENTSIGPTLVILSCKITCNTNVWKGITVVGSAFATILAFTPVSATVTIPLMLATSAASSGFSIADLVDSAKHEKGTVVAKRSFALALNLTTFASTGLTALCRVEKLRRMLPAGKLLQLERAEQILSGTMRTVTTGSVVVAVIGTVRGWETLSTAEWIELASLLCFAYREHFNLGNATRLFSMLQRDGVFTFFNQLCPNVPLNVLLSKLQGPQFDRFLQLAMQYLKDNVNYTVDDSFTTIDIFGYKLEFDLLFKIDWEKLKCLLLFLQTSKSTVSNGLSKATPWTQFIVNDVVKLLQMVTELPNYLCTVGELITLGHGHRFSTATVSAFLTAKKLDRLPLLRQLALFTREQTEALNALRESKRISGGDRELFNWLGDHNSSNYSNALLALVSIAEVLPKMTTDHCNSIKFTNKRINVSSLLDFNAENFLELPETARPILLGDDRFLRLCLKADERLLARANDAWMRTCCNEIAIQYLETIELLEQLFERVGTTSSGTPTLASALDYALDLDNTTVSQVYYSIASAWKQFTVPLDKRTLQNRFLLLLRDAELLGIAQYYYAPVPKDADFATNDETVITIIRTELMKLDSNECSILFGPVDRAACWLGMLPMLRNKASRKRLFQTLISLVRNGTGTVLISNDPHKRMVMFVNAQDKVIIEMVIPSLGDTNLRVSFYMCGNGICAKGAES